jgi:ankyrin repeat protein
MPEIDWPIMDPAELQPLEQSDLTEAQHDGNSEPGFDAEIFTEANDHDDGEESDTSSIVPESYMFGRPPLGLPLIPEQRDRELRWQIKTGNTSLVSKSSLAGADADGMLNKGKTPLFIAIKCRRIKIARMLLDKGADPNKAADTKIKVAVRPGNIHGKFVMQSPTPMHVAVFRKSRKWSICF